MTDQTPADIPPAEHCSRSACGKCVWWRLPLLLAVVLAVIMVLNGRGIRVADDAQEPVSGRELAVNGEASGATVSLEIDFGDQGERPVHAVVWHEGITVADALTALRHRANDSAGVKVTVQGSGQSALLTEIDGRANQGAGGANWTYAVNGQRADRSFAVYRLEPGDRVLWSFERSE